MVAMASNCTNNKVKVCEEEGVKNAVSEGVMLSKFFLAKQARACELR